MHLNHSIVDGVYNRTHGFVGDELFSTLRLQYILVKATLQGYFYSTATSMANIQTSSFTAKIRLAASAKLNLSNSLHTLFVILLLNWKSFFPRTDTSWTIF